MRMFITSKNKYLSNHMKIFGKCSIPILSLVVGYKTFGSIIYSIIFILFYVLEPSGRDISICSTNQTVHWCSPLTCALHHCPLVMKGQTIHCRVNPCDGCKAEFFFANNTKMPCDKSNIILILSFLLFSHFTVYMTMAQMIF